MIFSTGILICISWIILSSASQVFWVFKSSSSSSHLCLQVILVFKSSSSSDLDHLSIWIIMEHHHWIWIISQSGSTSLDWIWIITGSGSSLLDLDHHWLSSLDLDHHWCYLMILLVTESSTNPALFHVGCRPSLHVGLLQHIWPACQNGPSST